MSGNLNIKIQKLISNKIFFIKIKNNLNKNKIYWQVKKDPDGKLRNRLTNYERRIY